jgi:hypothetical protein
MIRQRTQGGGVFDLELHLILSYPLIDRSRFPSSLHLLGCVCLHRALEDS